MVVVDHLRSTKDSLSTEDQMETNGFIDSLFSKQIAPDWFMRLDYKLYI